MLVVIMVTVQAPEIQRDQVLGTLLEHHFKQLCHGKNQLAISSQLLSVGKETIKAGPPPKMKVAISPFTVLKILYHLVYIF